MVCVCGGGGGETGVGRDGACVGGGGGRKEMGVG